MNAPLPQGHMAEHKIEWLPVGAIAPSDTALQKLRRARMHSGEGLVGLAESIKTDGIWLPLIVRPLTALRGDVDSADPASAFATHELVAGERRWRAAQMAGLKHVPAIVRDLDDRDVVHAQITENIQRDTLSALEEAEGYRELIAAEHSNVDGILTIVGKSRSWVYDRLKLLELPPEGREALIAGKLDPYLALVVARVRGEKLQKKALIMAFEPGQTVLGLKRRISGGGFTSSLAGAPFALEDAKLNPAAGPCSTCPNRSGNASDFDPQKEDADVCTDVPCFELKQQNHQLALLDAARSSGRAVLTGAAARDIAPKADVLVGHVDLDQVFEDDEFPELEPNHNSPGYAEWEERQAAWQPRTWRRILEAALKPGEGLEPVLIEDPRTHALRQLVPVDRARRLLKRKGVSLPSWLGEVTQDTRASSRDQQSDPAALERHQHEQEEQRARQERELAHRQRVGRAIYDKWKGKLSRADWEAIAEQCLHDGTGNMIANALFGGDLTVEGRRERDLQALVMLAPVAQILVWSNVSPAPLFALARRLKIDPAKLKGEPKAKAEPEKKPAKKKARRK